MLWLKQIIKRLQDCGFSYDYQHLSYDYGSHLFVPMELPSAKFLKEIVEKIKNRDGKRGWIRLQKHWSLLQSGKIDGKVSGEGIVS